MNPKNWRPLYDRAKSEIKLNKKTRPEVSEYNPVPLYRSYGVTKRESIFTKINEILAVFVGWIIYIPCFIIIFIGTAFMVYAMGSVGVVFSSLAVLLFVYFVLARNIRKRARFIFKLRKKCRNLGYVFKFKRSFLSGLKFNKEGIDLEVYTPDKIWYLRFMTPKTHKSHITILNKFEMEIKTNITRSRMKRILGLDTVKVRRIDYSFNEVFKRDNIETQKVLLVNPVPFDMFKMDIDGARIPIGTGEKLYDYIMLSANGFINTLQREYDEKNGEQ